MLNRSHFINRLKEQLRIHSVAALLGPRQCGKTTLASQLAEDYPASIHHFDLENPSDLFALTEQPMRVLERLNGLVIIDEVQRIPALFPILRVLVDRKQAHYLILGSASRDLIQQSSETLAGRIGYIELTPFQLREDCISSDLLVRGGFPRSYFADSEHDSYLWREAYIQTFLERDIPNLGFQVPPLMLRRCWMMLAHVHGQLLNMNTLATSLSVSGHSIRHYLDILAGTFMVRIMLPWYSNIHKRQVKTPKLYFRDSGLLLALLGLRSEEAMLRHPSLGAIWEGFALEQVLRLAKPDEAYFWATHQGAELDLLMLKGRQRVGVEFKRADAPKVTPSMRIAMHDLKLDALYVVYPGAHRFSLADGVEAVPLWALMPGGYSQAVSE